MDIKRLLLVMFLILVITRVSDASSALKLGVLMAEGKGEEKPNSDKISPSPTPISSPNDVRKESSPKPPPKKQQPPPDSNKSGLKSPVSGSTAELVPSSGQKGKDPQGPQSQEHGKKNDGSKGKGPTGLENPVDKNQVEGCDASLAKCQVHEDLIACLQHPENDSKELVLLVQNAGEDALNVNIIVPTSIKIDSKMLNLAKHSDRKVNLSANAMNNLKIVLNAGKGDCVLQIGSSISDWNLFQHFPAYATQLTPMYGAYLLFFALVIAGGAWACCKFGKRGRASAGVSYQQLEMGAQPSQSSLTAVEASMADGWDQGWDDDWDEEEAVARPSDKSPTGNVSSNGLTSRSPNKKNGWDIDWDD